MSFKCENIFLTYANHSLKENPEMLYSLSKEIKKLYPGFDSKEFDSMIKRVLLFSGYRDPAFGEKMKKYVMENHPEKYNDPFISAPLFSALEANYGHRDGNCENGCSWRTVRRDRIGESYFIGSDRLNCYECAQMDFRNLLDELIEKGFSDRALIYLDIGRNRVHPRVVTIPQKESFKEIMSFRPGAPFSLNGGRFRNHKFVFQDCIDGWVSLSLGNFLLETDRRGRSFLKRLYQCQYCQDYFVAEEVRDRKFCTRCSRKNKMSRQQRREYQKTYRERVRASYQRKKVKSEREIIEKLMENLDISNKEAIELRNFDKSM